MATTDENIRALMEKRGKNIKALREEACYTQAVLGKRAGVEENYLSAIETGARNPGRKTIAKLCGALMVDEQTLLFGRKPSIDLEGLSPEKRYLREAIQQLEEDMDRLTDERAEEAGRLLRKVLRELREK